MTTFAVGVGAGKVVPELSNEPAWPFQVIGVGFAAVGLLFIGYGYMRQKRVEEAIARGGYAPFGSHAGFVFAGLGVLLGIGTMIVILLHPS